MDETENLRRMMVDDINSNPQQRGCLEAKHGKVWDTTELAKDFEVQGFMAPLVAVTRKSDGKQGTLTFQHYPRFYFDFQGV